MTIAANQPYLFPYLGYFQLIAAADRFVSLDSFQLSRPSWVNRNRLLVQGKPYMLSAQICKAPSMCPIDSYSYTSDFLKPWRQILQFNYARSPYIDSAMGIIEKLEGREEKNVARVNLHAIELVLEYVGIKKEILQLSEMDLRLNRGRLDNLIQIIQAAGGDRYINLPGGKALYTPEEFARYGVKLEFLEPWLPEYPQPRAPQFVPGLSMLDLIANLPAEKIRDLCHTRRKI